MNYWVMKARPQNLTSDEIAPGLSDSWWIGKRLKDWSREDRLFVWIGAPSMRLVALAELTRIPRKQRRDGRWWFRVIYRSNKLEGPLSISDLRKHPKLANASFLKSGPSGTLYSLGSEQGEYLYGLVTKYNPTLGNVWPDAGRKFVSGNSRLTPSVLQPPARIEVTTTRVIRDTARSTLLKLKYDNRCQVCELRIELNNGECYSEVHHIRPLGGKHRGLDDEGNFLVLCPNHHAMFDYGIPYFLSGKRIKIGQCQYSLRLRHLLDRKNWRYHNEKIYRS